MRQKTFVLAKAILERKHILFGSVENHVKPQVMKEKEDAWESVRTEMIEQGFANFERKSWRDVRNHDWQYLRRSAVAKYEHNQKAGVETIQYNEVDKLVFEIMGNEVSSYDNNDSANLNSVSNDVGRQNQLVDTSFFPLRTKKLEENQQRLNSVISQSISVGSSCDLSTQSKGLSQPAEAFLDSNEKQDVFSGTNLSPPCGEIHSELLHSLISSSSMIDVADQCEANPTYSLPISRPVISSTSGRKRPHSCSSASVKSMDDEVTEAKLRLLMMKIRKEEIMMQQETFKLAQEEAKLRQEKAKAELLEMQLRTERARANGVTL